MVYVYIIRISIAFGKIPRNSRSGRLGLRCFAGIVGDDITCYSPVPAIDFVQRQSPQLLMLRSNLGRVAACVSQVLKVYHPWACPSVAAYLVPSEVRVLPPSSAYGVGNECYPAFLVVAKILPLG